MKGGATKEGRFPKAAEQLVTQQKGACTASGVQDFCPLAPNGIQKRGKGKRGKY